MIIKMKNCIIDDEIEVGLDTYGEDTNSGRIYCASVILPNTYSDDKYLDIAKSNDINSIKLDILAKYIIDTCIDYSIDYIDITEYFKNNIIKSAKEEAECQAIIDSYKKSLDNLKTVPDNIAVRGEFFNIYKDKNNFIIPHQLVKADNMYRNVSAAWILAKYFHQKYLEEKSDSQDLKLLEAGIDEAGRGCLCGRVYTGAVILPTIFPDDKYLEIKDSKKLSKKKREELRVYIEKYAIAYSVSYSEPSEIDKNNILQATIIAMHRAIDNLKITPDILLIDGNYFKEYKNNNKAIPHKLIKGGDNIYRNIAAASILAKVYHDEHISNLLEKNPEYNRYGWKNNMGYGTKQHMDAIKQHGITEHHRKSFAPCS